MNRRMQRVNVVLRDEISHVLAEELRDPRLSSIVSVTRVSTSPDLSAAKVYVSVLGDEDDKRNTLKALRSAAGYVRKNIRRKISLKSVPHVEFHIDETIEQGAEMLKLIDEVALGPDDGGRS